MSSRVFFLVLDLTTGTSDNPNNHPAELPPPQHLQEQKLPLSIHCGPQSVRRPTSVTQTFTLRNTLTECMCTENKTNTPTLLPHFLSNVFLYLYLVGREGPDVVQLEDMEPCTPQLPICYWQLVREQLCVKH